MRLGVFLDRDGTIIEDRDYLREPSEIELIPGAAKALRLFNRLGLTIVVISNQSGIGRGLISEEQHALVHNAFMKLLRKHGCIIDGTYYCPHAPQDDCSCRKPKSGMLLAAASNLGISLETSFMIGDRLSDIQAGRRVGCQTALVLTGYGRDVFSSVDDPEMPDFVGDDVYAAALWIKQKLREQSVQPRAYDSKQPTSDRPKESNRWA